jgi:transcriptional regulator with XRE-family HTH domain
MNASKNPPLSLREIARRAGVSVATVSYVLNNDPRITISTRKKVRGIAEQIGYTPKPIVGRLMAEIRRERADKPFLALVTNWTIASPWKVNPFMRRFYEAISHRAFQLGYQIQEFWLGEKGITPKRLSRILKARNISGLIIPPGFIASKRLPFDISALAVATHGRLSWRPELNRVEPDQTYNTLLALRELRKLGYRRIGLAIFSGASWIFGHQIECAYSYYQSRSWIARDLPPFLRESYGPDKDFWHWLKKYQVECILTNDPGLLDNLRKADIPVPKKIGFACFGVIPELGDCAGIDFRADRLDAALVDMVVSQISLGERGAPESPRSVSFEGVWQPGGTVK